MIATRGMTLLEVLAATVLLALIVGMCLPVLTGTAARSVPESCSTVETLARVAEQLLDDPAAFGFEQGIDVLTGREPVQILVQVPTGRMNVRVTVVEHVSVSGGPHHAWLVVGEPGVSVSRWISGPAAAAVP